VINDSFIERLEEAHEFPGLYTLKVIGEQTDSFVATVLAALQGELQLSDAPEHTLKATPNGRHVSVTVELTVQSAQQVGSVYTRLQSMPEIRFLM
jgi:putative lipoic acid-binding regulatory protein